MSRVVTAKQPNSKMCLVCGLKNPFGLHAFFYELHNHELLAVFTPKQEHQGYPGRLHGGIATAILDESIGRSIMIRHRDQIWGVTLELNLRFKQPVPLAEEIRVISRTTTENSRIFEGTGEILLPDGTVAIEGRGKYLKLPLEKIADFDFEAQEWQIVVDPNDPSLVDL